MKFFFIITILFSFLFLTESISIEEKREIFANNIQNFIQKDLTLPEKSEELVSQTKTDITIIFQGIKISDLSSIQVKYGLSDELTSQIKTAQFGSSTSTIYSKLEEKIILDVGSIKETIGAAFKLDDMVYFAIIRGISKGTLRIKYEQVCHEECSKFLIFFEDCDTICDDVRSAYTQEEVDKIIKIIQYYSLQNLLSYIDVLRTDGYQAYFSDCNGIYSDDENYIAYLTDFGDIAIGPTKDLRIIQPVDMVDLIDDGTRNYVLINSTDEGSSSSIGKGGRRLSLRGGLRRLEEEGSTNITARRGTTTSSDRSTGTTGSRRSTTLNRSGRRSVTSTGTDTRGGVVRRSVNRGRRGDSLLNNYCITLDKCNNETTGVRRPRSNSCQRCVDYYDGNFHLFNFIGKGVNGGLTREVILGRMISGRQKGDYYMLLQNDGNLAIYNGDSIVWETGTGGQGIGPFNLKLTNDRYLILEDSTGKELYKSGIIEEYYIMRRAFCGTWHDVTISTFRSSGCIEEGRMKTYPKEIENGKEIFRCRITVRRNPHFMVSDDENCEGFLFVENLGWIYKSQVEGSFPLYRCKLNDDYFISTDKECEGQTLDKLIGYVDMVN